MYALTVKQALTTPSCMTMIHECIDFFKGEEISGLPVFPDENHFERDSVTQDFPGTVIHNCVKISEILNIIKHLPEE